MKLKKGSSTAPASDLEAHLREVWLPRPRLAVLAALRDHPHIDTDTVFTLVRADFPAVSRQTVYEVLRAFTDARPVRRIEPAGENARYEARVGGSHHHLVCRSCGSITDFDCAVGHAPCLNASNDHGYVIDEVEVVYWGKCPNCVPRSIAQESASSEGNR